MGIHPIILSIYLYISIIFINNGNFKKTAHKQNKIKK